MTQYMTPREAAERLRVQTPTLVRWVNKGLLTCVITPSGRRLYPAEEIETLMRGDGTED